MPLGQEGVELPGLAKIHPTAPNLRKVSVFLELSSPRSQAQVGAMPSMEVEEP